MRRGLKSATTWQFALFRVSGGSQFYSLTLELKVFERPQARLGRTLRDKFVVDEFKSVVYPLLKMLQFRTLIAVFAWIVALVRRFTDRVRDMRRGDQCRPQWTNGPGNWALVPIGAPLLPIVSALWREMPGGRESAPRCIPPTLVFFSARPSPLPLAEHSAGPGSSGAVADLNSIASDRIASHDVGNE
jgi:hypothetical protein